MCPSPTAPPKKLGSASEGLVHVLEPSEDPDMLLQRWPITSPILLVESADLLLAVSTMLLIPLPKEMIHQASLILMGSPTFPSPFLVNSYDHYLAIKQQYVAPGLRLR
ncbi:hypothetical protein JZ751_017186 [Albula glossodonta]|uniref:Uncharacterized protein n=1 Tax=Albula glossodonta TaxID=121402 RepID=A0A8T2NRI7_9TELE|nr:hypothetical protein JZ751_017186 [Albula glossodonta]